MKLKCLFAIVAIFTILKANAQDKEIYEGQYRTNTGLIGSAKFEFSQKGESRTKNGLFEFNASYKDSLDNSNSQTNVTWKGQYTDGKKSDSWIYEELRHQFDLLEIINFNPSYKLNSIRTVLNANYEEGLPDGQWKLRSQRLTKGIESDEIYEITCSFINGKIDGEIEIKNTLDSNQVMILEGNANNGLMVGEWIFQYISPQKDTITESRAFKQGFLQKLLKTSQQQDTTALLEFPHSSKINQYLLNRSDSNDVANAPLSLLFSDGYPRTSEYLQQQKFGNKLIQNFLSVILQFETDFIANNGLPLGTNRMRYELSESEYETMQKWLALKGDLQQSLERIEELQIQDFSYAENDTLAFISSWLNKQRALIEYVEPWAKIFKENELQYYNRNGLLPDYAKKLLALDTINYKGKYQVVEYPSQDSSFIFYILNNISQRKSYADSAFATGQQNIANIIRKGMVEERILALAKHKLQLDSLYKIPIKDTWTDSLRKYIQEEFIGNDIQKHVVGLLNSNQLVEEKSYLSDSLSRKIYLAEKIYQQIKKFPKIYKALDELYTLYKFDPYTFSDNVPIRMHKRLYEGTTSFLYHTLMREAMAQQNIEQIYEKMMLIRSSQQRLNTLINMEDKAKKIDRKMKHDLSKNEILKLLEI